jgi:PTS system ascorbate-specific IIA component
MSVGILLVTHNDIGTSLIYSLEEILGTLPLPIKALPVRIGGEPMSYCYHLEQLYMTVNEGHGVLVLTDIFGATPCNIACHLIENYRVRVVCGVNLPMLIKIMNYPSADLDTLANKALSGGTQGIFDVNKILN